MDFNLGQFYKFEYKFDALTNADAPILAYKWLNEQEKTLFVLISKLLLNPFANTLSQNYKIWALRSTSCQIMEGIYFCKFDQSDNVSNSQYDENEI